MGNIPIRIASMGPADFGKSTLFGYIVFNCDNSYWEQHVEKWKQQRDWFRADRMYTYIFDKIEDERRGHLYADGKRKFEGTTMVPTYVECTIEGKRYLFIDVPGHEKFISNATTGIFQAQSVVLVLAADDLNGIIEVIHKIKKYHDNKDQLVKQLRISRFWNILLYSVLVKTYGFRQLIVAISKMDLVDFDQMAFELAVDEIQPFLSEYSGLKKETIRFIPTSINVDARSDVNVTIPSPPEHPMSWYQGSTLLELLSQISPLQPEKGKLLIPVEEIYWKRLPGSPLILTGRIIRGTLSPGQDIQISPLCDSSREFYETDKLRGRVKNIRQRDQSIQLPWIGQVSRKSLEPDSCFEAGYVVGINLHPYNKTKYNLDKFRNYFRKGCIITGDGDNIISGNVLKAEVLVSIYSRQIMEGQSWMVYLYGQKKGDALVVSVHAKEEQLNEDHEDGCYVAEIELLLDFPTDYPGSHGEIDADIKDVVLRQNKSFCGGRVLGLYFVDRIKAILDYEKENSPPKEILEKPFKRFYDLKKISMRPKIKADGDSCWQIIAENPTSSDEISLIYRTLRRITPKPLCYNIAIIPKIL